MSPSHRFEAPDTYQLLTVAEASAALRVSRWTVNRLIQSRQLRTIKIGSRRLVPNEAIHEFVGRLGEVDD